MDISVNWGTQEIFVPQAYLTFVSGKLYSLDTNAFRLDLRRLESEPDGIPFLPTHRHNTEVTVAGTTFARTIEIINGYFITFENTGVDYSVRLEGSNNNFFDVDNGILNPTPNVTVIPGNSAGLVSGGGDPDEIWTYNIDGSEAQDRLKSSQDWARNAASQRLM